METSTHSLPHPPKKEEKPANHSLATFVALLIYQITAMLIAQVVCPETLAYMQVRGKAFEHVETLLDVLIESTGGSPPKRAKLDSAPAAAAAVAGSEGGS